VEKKTGERTLLASVLLSSPGPLVLGIALFLGRSSTQIADFIRRSVELVALIVSWVVFRTLHKDGEPEPTRRERLEGIVSFCVGATMFLSGALMLFMALRSTDVEKGNVLPGLSIAFLGVLVNTWFWIRYRKLNGQRPDAILAAQSRLYGAKSVVDTCVVLALMFVAFAPAAPITGIVDVGGSVVVAGYLLWNGVVTIRRRVGATE
jgi:divalent metal cation (Fe/Co/Zn/Cd) transporter